MIPIKSFKDGKSINLNERKINFQRQILFEKTYLN